MTVLSITALSNLIKRHFDVSFGAIKVRGEISNLTIAASGHTYFVLKDENAILKVVIWQSSKTAVKLENGMRVICGGKLNIYQARSEYQLVASSAQYDGVGALMEMFEKRKKKLASEGLFDVEHKKALSKLPGTIGIITSATGAVIEDILIRLSARLPCKVIVRDVPVQGADAASAIARAIIKFNLKNDVDTIIIARGGGSLEDLWAFNEEIVVRSIAASNIPIISAVGHETDVTLSDYAADVRAPTPTAAAEMVTISREDVFLQLRSYVENIESNVLNNLQRAKNRISRLTTHIIMFDRKLHELSKIIELTMLKIKTTVRNKFDNVSSKLISPNKMTILNLWNDKIVKLESIHRIITSCGHESIMNRGLAMIFKGECMITRAQQLTSGDQITIRFADGDLEATID